MSTIPTLCDACRTVITPGDGDLADLLEFEPAPRKVMRPDGWTPDLQRAFIAGLAETGSPRRAADALGKNVSGAVGLYRSDGAHGFRAAWDRALAIGRARTARPAIEPVAPPPGITPRVSPPAGGTGQREGLLPDCDPAAGDELAVPLFARFMLKLRQERVARLAGRIAEADFYLRQISFFEVALDLAGPGLMDTLARLRRNGSELLDIAETDASRMLDRMRRKAWLDVALDRLAAAREGRPEQCDAPEPPDPFAPHLLADHGGVRTEPLPCKGPFAHPAEGFTADRWADAGEAQRKRAYADQFASAAAHEQVKFEQWMIAEADAEQERSGPGEFSWEMLDDEEGMKAIEEAVESVKQAKLAPPRNGGEEHRVSGGQPSTGGQSLGDHPQDGGGVDGA